MDMATDTAMVTDMGMSGNKPNYPRDQLQS